MVLDALIIDPRLPTYDGVFKDFVMVLLSFLVFNRIVSHA